MLQKQLVAKLRTRSVYAEYTGKVQYVGRDYLWKVLVKKILTRLDTKLCFIWACAGIMQQMEARFRSNLLGFQFLLTGEYTECTWKVYQVDALVLMAVVKYELAKC